MASSRHTVRLSRGPRRRRLLHGRIGAPDRAAVSGAASGREAHHRARRRPVHRAGGGRRAVLARDARVILRSARSPAMRCRRYSSTTSAPTSSASTRSIACLRLLPARRARATRARRGERRRVRAVSVARPRRPRAALCRPPAARRALPAARPRQHPGHGRQSALLPAVRSRVCARAHETGPRRRDGTARRARRVPRRRLARATCRCSLANWH